ncbi:hypothetical protein VTN31DRAFT_2203 [Thermomyces dupontii]|uniref:uncharacterized protein n=1 Tax=Talaromyces thermophilus TaxID=28565 RepID=UPI003744027A
MAFPEREPVKGLRIDTNFSRGISPARIRDHGEYLRHHKLEVGGVEEQIARGGDDESSVIKELHTETPPISVPRPDDLQILGTEAAPISYSHKPEDPSPFESFLRDERSSPPSEFAISPQHDGAPSEFQDAVTRADDGGAAWGRAPVRRSALRHMESQRGWEPSPADDGRQEETSPGSSPAADTLHSRAKCAHPLHIGNSAWARQEGDRPTSLTSVSTMSPTSDEVQTPPASYRDGAKFMYLSPLSMSPVVHRATSLDDPSLWSAGAVSAWGDKPRSYNPERNGALQRAMRQSSRRSTASSTKSPASMFLSMWSAPEVTPPAPKPDDEGQMVGTEYVLGKQIGFGGFSTVKEAYKVDESGSTKCLAVKIVRKHVAGKSERENDQVQAEFDHEVRIWRYLHHKHILSLEAVYETEFATFCFTRLAIGGTLFDLIKSKRSGLDLPLAKKYTYQLASALRYLHEDARVVHRDIKLENCLLDPVKNDDGTESATLVLCDFGMAEWMTTDNGGGPLDPYDNPADRPPPRPIGPSGSSTSVAGSLEYASPELLLSSVGLINPAVDVWAFGVVAYATVVGSRPFQHSFAPRIQARIIKGDWDQNAVLAPGVDLDSRRAALDLMRGCLEMDVKRRWTIRQILDSAWLNDYPEKAPEDTPWR